MPVPRREPRGVVGVARALGVEGGDAEAADADRDGGEREARRHARRRPIPTAASATPTGISHASESRSETAPNAGWMIEEPTVTNSSRAPDRAVGVAAFGDQERDQRGNGALAEIRDRVA